MSIYFFHFISAFLPLGILAGIFSGRLKLGRVFLALFLGFLFGYFAYFIAAAFLKTQNLSFIISIIYLALLVLSLGLFARSLLALPFLTLPFLTLLGLCVGVNYYVLSQDFPVFTSALIDSSGVASLGFIGLGLLFCVFIFFFLRWEGAGRGVWLVLFLAVFFVEGDRLLASVFLSLMRSGSLDTAAALVSFVGRSAYLGAFAPYFYLALLFLAAALAWLRREPRREKASPLDLKFRKNKAERTRRLRYVLSTAGVSLASVGLLLYFQLIASRPLSIDPPTELLPNAKGDFVFDLATLRDNKLHRYAYISAEGKIIRFFLLNKREDRDSPVAVFDACAICGDMGYVKRDGELICISCNVRLFLPSIGKAGGCNPIPLAYTYEDGKITIHLKDVIAGSTFFSQVKEIEVSDPISGEKILNTKAPFSYSFRGINYYFVNQKNYEDFKKDPSKFIDENASSAAYLIHRSANVN